LGDGLLEYEPIAASVDGWNSDGFADVASPIVWTWRSSWRS